MIGDMDNNGVIEIPDATELYRLAGICEKNSFTDVNSLNFALSHGFNMPIDWKAIFPNLIYAEVADADNNGKIEKADSDEVLHYYSDKAALLDLSNYFVGNEGTIKTLTIVPSN